MTDDLVFADSAGHTLIDVEAAQIPQAAANDTAPPVPGWEEAEEKSSSLSRQPEPAGR